MNDSTLHRRNFLVHLQERPGSDEPVLLKEPSQEPSSLAHAEQLHNEYAITCQLAGVAGGRPALAKEGTESRPVLLLEYIQGQSLAELIRTASLDLAERPRLAMASKRPRLESPGITAPTPALSAGAGRSLSGVFMRWTRWCARSAVARCGSSRSSPTTTSRTRSCDTSRRPRRGLLAVH